MITAKDIKRKTMSPEKVKESRNDIFAFYIGRPISYLLTIPFLYLGLKPNMISLLSLIPSIVGFVLLSFGTSNWIKIIGVLCFILWNFMDGIDGNVARYTNQTSKLGILWDATSGYFALILMHFSVGIAVYNTPLQFIEIPFIPTYMYIVLAGLTALSCLLSRLVMHKKMLLFSAEAGSSLNNKGNYSLYKIIALNITSPSGFMQVIMLLAIAGYLGNIFVLLYFLLHMLILVASLTQLLK